MGLLNATAASAAELIDKHGDALTDQEDVRFVFKTVRDFIAFTNWRVLYINVQGLTGAKREYLTVPYRSITAFSIETAGTFDLDAELKIYLSGRAPIEFRIGRDSDIRGLQGWMATKIDR
ncbi:MULTISPECIES: PH domain-containing protein [Sphingomonas]|jgi:hypothetical protein|uniref:PH domain-containing protein n=1 Tax=Sphingomonas TaxID=13687 RepID=UPI0024130A61|nr:PH domain-containing protein [Sphingomonas echinoides]